MKLVAVLVYCIARCTVRNYVDCRDENVFCVQILGTPVESTWPGVSSYPEYKPCKWNSVNLRIIERLYNACSYTS